MVTVLRQMRQQHCSSGYGWIFGCNIVTDWMFIVWVNLWLPNVRISVAKGWREFQGEWRSWRCGGWSGRMFGWRRLWTTVACVYVVKNKDAKVTPNSAYSHWHYNILILRTLLSGCLLNWDCPAFSSGDRQMFMLDFTEFEQTSFIWRSDDLL